MFAAARRLRAYAPVPSSDPYDRDGLPGSKRRAPIMRLSGRRVFLLVLIILCANVAFLFVTGRIGNGRRYPQYRSLEEIWAMEHALPQHDLRLPRPEGRNGRYVQFSNMMWGVGFNNLLGETLLLAHLAMKANRAFVFHNFVDPNHTWYPANAWIAGPTAGGPWPTDMKLPRNVDLEYWEQVCPQERRTLLDPVEVNTKIGVNFDNTPGDIFMDKWAGYLAALDDHCVEVKAATHQLFDIFFFGREDLLKLWPQMSKSPIMTHFQFSIPVEDAVLRNMRLISPSSPATPWLTGATKSIDKPANTGIQRLVAVHIRRGDFEEHCNKLAGWSAGFASWNLLGELPDKFTPGSPKKDYLRRCWPDVDEIASRLHEVRALHDKREGAGHELESVYVMTNGEPEWVESLRLALYEDGWRTVTTSKDLVLDRVAASVDAAVDMEIARRAEVFVGNGFSTLSATVTALRLTLAWLPQNIRFL